MITGAEPAAVPASIQGWMKGIGKGLPSYLLRVLARWARYAVRATSSGWLVVHLHEVDAGVKTPLLMVRVNSSYSSR